MKIRKATKKDFELIMNFEKRWEKEGISWGVKHPSKKELLKHISNDIVLIIEINGKPVGHAIGMIKKSDKERDWAGIKKGEKYGYIDGMYVCKKHRNKGLGKLLIGKLIEEFSNKKIKTVELKAVNKDLRKLVRFYENSGFKEKTTDMVKKLK